jgi:tagatose-1,6-bisphosphate aldolase|tara:strand:- start:312 stop:734 length:423 start_codon:yes stop_codon:yes gene_type:complete
MVNIDNIFDLFGSDDNLDGTDNSTTLIDFKNTPTYWVGMYKKLILNHNNFNITMVKFLKKSNKDFDMEDIKDAGEFVTYNRAWSYIKKIDISKKEHLKSVKIYADEYLDVTLKLSINFFIETEEYEKCAHLQKILNYLSK